MTKFADDTNSNKDKEWVLIIVKKKSCTILRNLEMKWHINEITYK